MAGETTSKTWTYDKDNKEFQEQNPDVPPVVDDEQQKAKLEQEARDKRLYGQNRQIINLNSSRYRGLGNLEGSNEISIDMVVRLLFGTEQNNIVWRSKS